MPSVFDQEHLSELIDHFGQPVLNVPLSVSKVVDKFGGRTAGDVRPNHALRAARHTRRRDTWSLDNAGGDRYRMTIGLSDVTTTDRPHSLISLVQLPCNADPYVSGAWRTSATATDLTPTEALLTMVEQCGIPVQFGATTALFITHAISQTRDLRLSMNPIGEARMEASIRHAPDGWHASWAYAIDTAKYLKTLHIST
jgi:hypothetical protein